VRQAEQLASGHLHCAWCEPRPSAAGPPTTLSCSHRLDRVAQRLPRRTKEAVRVRLQLLEARPFRKCSAT